MPKVCSITKRDKQSPSAGNEKVDGPPQDGQAGNADLLRLLKSYIQTFLFLVISNFYVQSTPPTTSNSSVAINCDMSRPSLPNKGILSHAKAHVKATTCRNRKYPARRKSIG